MSQSKLATLIVDDEAPARRVLRSHIEKLPLLRLVGECSDGVNALAMLRKEPVSLLLLDIHMPELSGLELLATLDYSPHVILTTAHAGFALQSYEFGVIDYLLKPIGFTRFLKAVNRISSRSLLPPAPPPEPAYLDIRHDGLPVRIAMKELQIIKSFGNYLRLITSSKTYTVLGTLANYEDQLPNGFQRIHKSYIVNTLHVDQASGKTVKVAGKELPLSPLYKLLLLAKLADRKSTNEG